MSDLAQMIDGACYVYRNEDLGQTIVWNGSATFNVYADTQDPREFDPVDCFSRYASEGGYGPKDAGMSFAEGIQWAKDCVAEWIADTYNEEELD